MKKGWEIKRLEDCFKLKSGDAMTSKKMQKGIFPVFGGNGIAGYHNAFNLSGSNVIIGRVGALCGRVRHIDEKIWLTDNAFRVTDCKYQFDHAFLTYLLNLKDFRNYARQAAQPVISNSSLKDVVLEFPLSLPEQQRIVEILDKAFAQIAKAKQNAEKNLQNAKELFESYLQGVFTNPNNNWEKKKWGELCDFVRGPFGGSLKKSIFKEKGYVVYEQKHAIHDHFNQLRYFIDENKFKEMIRFEIKPGDIIMSCSGVTLGRVAIIPENIKRGIINQALLKLTPKKNVSVHFIKHWLRSKIFQDIIFKYSGGAAIPNVPSAKILKEILIPLPSLNQQNQIVNNIELMLAETKKLEAVYEQKINALEELKKSILQKAFSGELSMVNV